jgi:hypothetical protein
MVQEEGCNNFGLFENYCRNLLGGFSLGLNWGPQFVGGHSII